MNRTVVFVTFAALAGVLVLGSVILAIHRPDATATLNSLIVTVLAVVAGSAGTFYGLGKLNEKVDAVQRQTNGTLSKKDEEIAQLRVENRELHVQAAKEASSAPE
jgi:hypothetical protein